MAANRLVLAAFLAAIAVPLAVAASLSANPCDYTPARTLFSLSGLDPLLISCSPASTASDDDDTSAIANANNVGVPRRNTTGPMVTDLSVCGRGSAVPPHAIPPSLCCPPPSPVPPIDFTFPDPSEPMRVRRRMHMVSPEFLANFTRAIELMKALPHDDPRSFYQQANIHCAYCTGAYKQLGHPDLDIQVHNTWFFQPLHRGYLYFFERILGKLIGDPTFALPFWNWDAPDGMQMPAMFADPSSPLFDPLRNSNHTPPRLFNMDFDGCDPDYTDKQQIDHNLRLMYRQLITNAPLPSLFHGQPYRPGTKANPGPGSLETYPHNAVHFWSGDMTQLNHEDMGTYYSAGRDPILYPHHSNIDRMWDVWRALDPERHRDFTDHDWLESSFIYYDEEARLVRMRVRDTLDASRLRYTYEDVSLPWVSAKPPVTPGVNRRSSRAALRSVRFPVALELDQGAVTAEVTRPRVSRSRLAKAVEEEVLVVEGIQFDGTEFVKFDVYINAPEYQEVGLGSRELAGSYISLKHRSDMHDGRKGMETSMRLALNELLEDLDAEEDETVTVTLVPRRGKVRIGGLKIEYLVE